MIPAYSHVWSYLTPPELELLASSGSDHASKTADVTSLELARIAL